MSRTWLVRFGLAASVAVVMAAVAMSQDKIESTEKRRTIQISFGQVISVNEEKVASAAGSGALVGGIIGAAATHGKTKNKIEGAAAGALIGALLTRAAEGKHKAWGVTIKKADGSAVKVILDHIDGIESGACVQLEEGVHTNCRRVSPELCGTPAVAQDSTILAAAQLDAELCHAAKEQLAKANTKEEFELIMQKVKVLCH